MFWLLFGKKLERNRDQEHDINLKSTKRESEPVDAESLIPQDWKQVFSNENESTKMVDPCQKARDASMSCIYRNYKEKKTDTVCKEYFDAYKTCKKRFLDQRREDRLKGRG